MREAGAAELGGEEEALAWLMGLPNSESWTPSLRRNPLSQWQVSCLSRGLCSLAFDMKEVGAERNGKTECLEHPVGLY
jgi:hypothetical protein